MSSEVTGELVEELFSKHSDSGRFANFCNAVVIAECSASEPTMPVLLDKPGADGGMDGEWTIPANGAPEFESPFGSAGWNAFQYKARSIAGNGRQAAFSKLCSDLDGALAKLVNRLTEPKECRQYSLFTNLQLGLETATKTRDDKILQKQRAQLKTAIAEGSDGNTSVEIFDAAQLAAIVNAHPALRLTYFSGRVAGSWNDAWEAEHRIKDYKPTVPFIGRSKELSQISEWLKATTAKVIVLCGPSGMGKTRLALEATRPFAPATTVVDAVDELLRMDFQALGTSKATRFIIVEDPTREQAEALAKRAVACEGVKLILTVPTDSKAPALKLTEHQAIKVLSPLQPLNNADAENLLKAAGAAFDRQALDWVLLQAGGNPEILLSAAEFKGELREKSEDLKRQLHKRFCDKISRELGDDGIRALRTLSPVLYVKTQGENPELESVCDCLGTGIQAARIREILSDLERMGYIRRRGSYVSVVPPLFAARLVEELAATHDQALRRLFHALAKSSRSRFLERMVTVDLPENSAFWDFMFGANGPLQHDGDAEGFLECLARAVPARTARFLDDRLRASPDGHWVTACSGSVLRELVYAGESCATGMRCLEMQALKEIERTGQLREAKLFLECFVDWNSPFPMSYAERSAWLERLSKSENKWQRLLGAQGIAYVTVPPPNLSGYTVTARRLGQAPPMRMLRERWDYMAKLVDLRFELTQSQDQAVAEVARSGFDECASRLSGHVPADQLVTIIEKFADWHFIGKLPSNVRKLRGAIRWLEKRFTEASQNPAQEAFRDKWAEVLGRLAVLRERFDGGDFVLRLRLATDHTNDYSWEPGGEGRIYSYQKRLQGLASEAVGQPSLVTEEAWSVLRETGSQHGAEFVTLLGECDKKKEFLARFESVTGEEAGKIEFGFYCLGVSRSDAQYIEEYIERLAQRPSFDRNILLWPIQLIGSTPANRARLLGFIADRSVSPVEVNKMFMFGRWLEGVPVSEVVMIMDFMAQGADWTNRAAHVLSLYLHPEKALPKELIPFAERLLGEIQATLDSSYECNRIAIALAKTDLDRAFALLEKQMALQIPAQWCGQWNPLEGYGGLDFWNHLVARDAERAYRCFCGLRPGCLRSETLSNIEKPLHDLVNHQNVLLKLANENEHNAEVISTSIWSDQPGFFPFSIALLAGRPMGGKVEANLSSAVVSHFGFSSSTDELQAAMRSIELQLKDSEMPIHGRVWLEKLKMKVSDAIKTSPWNSGEPEPLGWV